jgi:hypothetical protein
MVFYALQYIYLPSDASILRVFATYWIAKCYSSAITTSTYGSSILSVTTMQTEAEISEACSTDRENEKYEQSFGQAVWWRDTS